MMAKAICLSRDNYHIVKDDFIEPFLEDRGFKQVRKEWFFRMDGDSVWRIASGFTRDGALDQGEMRLFVGVGFHSLNAFLKDYGELRLAIREDGKRPCVIASDLARLIPRGWEHYWITPSSDPKDVADVAIADLASVGFEYFEKFGTVEKCIEAWSRGEGKDSSWADYYLAAGYWLRGQCDQANGVIEAERVAAMDRFKERGNPLHAQVAEEYEAFAEWLHQQPRSA